MRASFSPLPPARPLREDNRNGVSRSGHASLHVEVIAGQSAITSATSRNPLKLLTPRSRGESVWACLSSFGGGLVAGDQTQLDIQLGAGARCFAGTQASTKVYRNPTLQPCSHSTRATLDGDSLLVFAPDPVQAFADSVYQQRQEFRLRESANLALLDWLTSGRAACGERWAFREFRSRNDVFINSERVFVDSITLNSRDGALASSHRTGRFNCFATLLFIGPRVAEIAARTLHEINSRPIERGAATLCSASAVRDGAVLRFAGESVEQVGRELHGRLKPLGGLLGDDPWGRKNL